MRARRLLGLFLCFSLWGAKGALSRPPSDNPVIGAMDEAIQDEYRAYATYQKVISDFGEVRPFSNIVEAEARHIEALTALYEKRGLGAPESRWRAGNVPSYESVKAACEAAVRGELENIAMYDRLLKIDLPGDVEQVFRRLRAASSENHLPAFRRCAERRQLK